MKLFSKNKSKNDDPELQEKPEGISKVKKSVGSVAGRIKKWPKKKIIIVSVCTAAVIAAVVLLIIFVFSGGGSSDTYFTTSAVETRDITVTLSGSGTLEPAGTYDVTTQTTGDVLSDSFEEGDEVTEGQILYTIDTTEAEKDVKSAQLSLDKAELTYEDAVESESNLTVKAPTDGTITSLDVEVGDSVSNGQSIGTIRNSSVMSLVIPFNSADVDSLYVGETAEVTMDSTFETLEGTVTKISNVEQVTSGNMLVKYVTIDVDNPGGITTSTCATAKIGDIACNSSATFTYKSEKNITAESSGEVTSISVDEGDYVSKNGTILTLENASLAQSVGSAEISLEEAQETLDEQQEILDGCTVTAPVAGTVVEKNYETGDTVGESSGSSSSGSSYGSSSSSSSSGTVLCTIYDLSYLTMEISVDELDVSEVELGQEVEITSDAVENTTYTGTVTEISIEGTTSNGVTTYPITIQIDDTDGLLPGMNVDAEIVVESSGDSLCVPVSAVVRGDMVLVKTSGSATAGEVLQANSDGLPDGFEYVEVTLGVNDDDYIAVTSGLSEGDIIAVETINTDTGESSSSGGLSSLIGGSTSGDMPTSGSTGGDMPSSGSTSGGMPSGGGDMPSGGGMGG